MATNRNGPDKGHRGKPQKERYIMKDIMKDFRKTTHETGDHVKCMNCETEMIVAVGEETCPICGKEGTLAWADKNNEEVTL